MKRITQHVPLPRVTPMGEERPVGKLAETLRSLGEHSIPFRGPFQTPKGNRIFVVMDRIVTESELIQLYDADKLTRQNIEKIKKRIGPDTF